MFYPYSPLVGEPTRIGICLQRLRTALGYLRHSPHRNHAAIRSFVEHNKVHPRVLAQLVKVTNGKRLEHSFGDPGVVHEPIEHPSTTSGSLA